MINTHSIGLALGGGGVKGLAHIGLLKLLDKYELNISQISGTSMGAIIGALYSLGLSGEEIEERVREHIFVPGERVSDMYKKRSKLIKWAKIFSFEKSRGGIVTANGLFLHLFNELIDIQFSQLKIPFIACATDFNTGKEYAFNSGDVLTAVQASMAVPGIFAPVKHNDNLYVDGGLVNNLPVNHLKEKKIKIASDVITLPTEKTPKTLAVINGGINIMIAHATQHALKEHPVDLLFNVDTTGIDAFNFRKVDEALKRGDIAAQKFQPVLEQFLEHKT